MAQYIDKAAVVAAIRNKVDSYKGDGIISISVLKQHCEDFIYFLDTLETKEGNLEEEINRFWDSCIKHKNERGGNVIWSNKLEIEVLARHFYELGLKAKGE